MERGANPIKPEHQRVGKPLHARPIEAQRLREQRAVHGHLDLEILGVVAGYGLIGGGGVFEHQLPRHVDYDLRAGCRHRLPAPARETLLADPAVDPRRLDPAFEKDAPLLVEPLPGLQAARPARLGSEKGQKPKVLRGDARHLEFLAHDRCAPAGPAGKLRPLAEDAAYDSGEVLLLEMVGDHAFGLAHEELQYAPFLHGDGRAHGQRFQPARGHRARVSDVGETNFGLPEQLMILGRPQKTVDEFHRHLRHRENLVEQPGLVRMIRVQGGAGDEDIRRPARVGHRGQPSAQPESLGESADRRLDQPRDILPFRRIGHHQVVEQLEPGINRLDMNVIIRGVAQDGTRQFLQVGREDMPLDQLGHVKVRRIPPIIELMDIGLRLVRKITRSEPDILDGELVVVLERGDEVPLAAPIQLGQDVDLLFAQQREEVLGMRARRFLQQADGALLVALHPAGHCGVKPGLGMIEPVQTPDGLLRLADQPKRGVGLPIVGSALEGGGGVIARCKWCGFWTGWNGHIKSPSGFE